MGSMTSDSYGPVEWNGGVVGRPRPAGDQDVVRLDPIATLRGLHLELAGQHHLHAEGQIGDGDGVPEGVIPAVERALLEPRQVQDRLAAPPE